MLPVLLTVLSAACSGDAPVGAAGGSFLYQPAFCIDEVLRGPPVAYVPQPGDLMLRLDGSKFWRVTHYLALAFDPNGSGIVFARPDGSMAILEAGPNDCLWVRTLDLLPHLKEYADIGRVWIRRRRVPLTPEQSCRLTEFALAQDGKRFACDLATTINALLADPAGRARMGAKARERVERHFSWPSIARQTLDFYRTLASVSDGGR